jgi:tRNA(adenine34) deaminase
MIFPVSLPQQLSGNNFLEADLQFMQRAIELAQYAQTQNEVPVGAVLVLDQQIIGEGWNQVISQHDPSAHAEIMALREAGKSIQNYRLLNTTLYVTLEPCAMCASALVHARIQNLVFAAPDPKTGAVMSCLNLLSLPHLNHQISWQSGLCAATCSTMLSNFFKMRR